MLFTPEPHNSFVTNAINKIFGDKFDKSILKKVQELIKNFKYEDLMIKRKSIIEHRSTTTYLADKITNIVRPSIKKILSKRSKLEYETYHEYATSKVAESYLVVALLLRDKNKIPPYIALKNIWDSCYRPRRFEDERIKVRDIYLPMKWLTINRCSIGSMGDEMYNYEYYLKSREFDEDTLISIITPYVPTEDKYRFCIDATNKIFNDKFDDKILKKISNLIGNSEYKDFSIKKEKKDYEPPTAMEKEIKIAQLIGNARDIILPYFKKTISNAKLGKWTNKGYETFKHTIMGDLRTTDIIVGTYLTLAFAIRNKNNTSQDLAVVDIYRNCHNVLYFSEEVPSSEEIMKGDSEIYMVYLLLKWLLRNKYPTESVKKRMYEYESKLKTKNFDEREFKRCKIQLIILVGT